MNEYPNKNSVIVMDNAKIHHDEKLIESIEQMGCKVLYLPHTSLIIIQLKWHFPELNHG